MANSNRRREGRRVSPLACCPYYKFESKQMIYCDSGHIAAGSTMHLAFETGTNCKEWKNTKCHDNYKECFIYQRLGEDDAEI